MVLEINLQNHQLQFILALDIMDVCMKSHGTTSKDKQFNTSVIS